MLEKPTEAEMLPGLREHHSYSSKRFDVSVDLLRAELQMASLLLLLSEITALIQIKKRNNISSWFHLLTERSRNHEETPWPLTPTQRDQMNSTPHNISTSCHKSRKWAWPFEIQRPEDRHGAPQWFLHAVSLFCVRITALKHYLRLCW